MKSWIFQATRERSDLKEELRKGRAVTWLVTRFREEISKGDIVYFWQSGESKIRGIYAWGIIKGAPQFFDGWGYGIEVSVEEKFDQHISSDHISALQEMRKHLLFRMAIGTNFQVTPEQHNEIVELITSLYPRLKAPVREEVHA